MMMMIMILMMTILILIDNADDVSAFLHPDAAGCALDAARGWTQVDSTEGGDQNIGAS